MKHKKTSSSTQFLNACTLAAHKVFRMALEPWNPFRGSPFYLYENSELE